MCQQNYSTLQAIMVRRAKTYITYIPLFNYIISHKTCEVASNPPSHHIITEGQFQTALKVIPSNTGNILVQLVAQHRPAILQVERRCCPYYQRLLNLSRKKNQCCKLKKLLQKVVRNILLQFATLNLLRGKLW